MSTSTSTSRTLRSGARAQGTLRRSSSNNDDEHVGQAVQTAQEDKVVQEVQAVQVAPADKVVRVIQSHLLYLPHT